jgi:transposase-like protein
VNHQADVEEMDFSSEIVIPERSTLFSLQPIGVGTPHQESLLSFLVRTSHAHAVNPRLLIREIFPQGEAAIARLPSAAFFQREIGTINGLGQYAQIFVSAMERLTGRHDLHGLTMLQWQALFPHNGQGLLARHPRWCPACLDQQRREEGESSFPLVWSLEAYQVCETHLVPLECRCSSCGKMQPYIPSFPDLSICAYCRMSLGGIRSPVEQTDFKVWVSGAIGDMVARQSIQSIKPKRERFHEFVREQITAHAGGNRTAFCRAVGLNDFGVSGWLNKGARPSFSQFLTVCYGTHTMPMDIFLDAGLPTTPTALMSPAEKLKERAAIPRLDYIRRATTEQVLREHLDLISGESVSAIAKKLGVGRTCLRYWFPELCEMLSEQHQRIANNRSQNRRRQQCVLVEEVMARIQAEGSSPTKRKVNMLLQIKGITLSQPHLMNAYKKRLALSSV